MRQSDFLDYEFEYEDSLPDFDFSPALYRKNRIYIVRNANRKSPYFYVYSKYVAHCIDISSCDLFERGKWYKVKFENFPRDNTEYDWCSGLDNDHVDNAQIDISTFKGTLAIHHGDPTFVISFNKTPRQTLEKYSYSSGVTKILKAA